MQSEAELVQSLSELSQQSAQVEELLALDGANTDFLKLRADLQQVTALTQALLAQVVGEGGGAGGAGAGAGMGAGAGAGTAGMGVGVGAGAGAGVGVGMGVGMGAGVGAGAPSSSARGATYTGTMGSIQVGEAVEVIGGDRLYTGVVTAIIDQTEYKVRYFEFPDPVSLPPSRWPATHPPLCWPAGSLGGGSGAAVYV
ncbi:hypothetical protein B484DRAFT_420346 [Ochromonadaceae sp. CCMP2298]|nr:hypothetical protein B484DRAFT_420346 [Ochromonadaceae sp. CCMP2298]